MYMYIYWLPTVGKALSPLIIIHIFSAAPATCVGGCQLELLVNPPLFIYKLIIYQPQSRLAVVSTEDGHASSDKMGILEKPETQGGSAGGSPPRARCISGVEKTGWWEIRNVFPPRLSWHNIYIHVAPQRKHWLAHKYLKPPVTGNGFNWS